jgi:ATP-binding cassette subfamily B protein
LTRQRLLTRTGDNAEWRSHALRPGLRLTRRDRAGVGSLELFDADGRLALWRYSHSAIN